MGPGDWTQVFHLEGPVLLPAKPSLCYIMIQKIPWDALSNLVCFGTPWEQGESVDSHISMFLNARNQVCTASRDRFSWCAWITVTECHGLDDLNNRNISSQLWMPQFKSETGVSVWLSPGERGVLFYFLGWQVAASWLCCYMANCLVCVTLCRKISVPSSSYKSTAWVIFCIVVTVAPDRDDLKISVLNPQDFRV